MTNIPKSLFDKFIYSGQLLSVGVVSVVASSVELTGGEIDLTFFLMIYCGANSIYLFDRLRDLRLDRSANPSRVEYLEQRYKGMLWLLLLLILVILVILFYNIENIAFFIVTVITYSVGFLYNIYLKGLTRKMVAFKNLFVPLEYALLIIIASIYFHRLNEFSVVLLAIFVFARLFVAVAFYDLKDRIEDRENGINTLAVVLSRERLNLLLGLVNIISAVPIVLGVSLGYLQPYSLVLILTIPYCFTYIYFAKFSKNLSYFSYVFCDGEFLLWFPLTIMAKILWS